MCIHIYIYICVYPRVVLYVCMCMYTYMYVCISACCTVCMYACAQREGSQVIVVAVEVARALEVCISDGSSDDAISDGSSDDANHHKSTLNT
jgi:hypothetical protein